MHAFQPKHCKLKKDEIDKLLQQYNISLTQLPKISKHDQAIASLGLEIGDVVKMERKEEGRLNTYYRVVV